MNKLREFHPDLVLLDINMPGMGGLATCREIRTGTNAGIVMLTVRNSEEDKIAALDAGADDFVTKPFSTPELLRILVWHGIWGSYGEQFARIALTVGASLIGVVLFGTIAGAMLPLLLRFCRIDPASASAPAVPRWLTSQVLSSIFQ